MYKCVCIYVYVYVCIYIDTYVYIFFSLMVDWGGGVFVCFLFFLFSFHNFGDHLVLFKIY